MNVPSAFQRSPVTTAPIIPARLMLWVTVADVMSNAVDSAYSSKRLGVDPINHIVVPSSDSRIALALDCVAETSKEASELLSTSVMSHAVVVIDIEYIVLLPWT